jgi:hypothetical protein
MPDAAAQTRIVSVTGIRLNSRESVRSFKGIISDDISEFESYMPSHAVRLFWRLGRLFGNVAKIRALARLSLVSELLV